MDTGTQQLYQCLVATLDPSTCRAAEAALAAGSNQPGFGSTLLRIVLLKEAPYGIRQLAAMVLKKHVKEHWTFESPHFLEPPVDEGEKAQIREMLPTGLSDENSKIRTAVGMAIAAIAKFDCPQQWPNLLPGLVHAITDKKDINLVNGTVRCLAMFVDELGEDQVLEIAPLLLPELLLIVRHDEYGETLQRKALAILHVIVSVLHMLTSNHPKEVRALVAALVGDWFAEFARILAKPLGTEDVGGWGVKMECLRVMVLLVSSFSKLCAPHIGTALQLSWQMFVGALSAYQALVIDGEDEDAGGQDSEGGSIDLESLLSQLMEFLLTVIGNRRYQGGVKASMEELQYVTLGYMQMTSAQVSQWSTDPNLYAAQDDDFSSVRATGEMVLDELVEVFEGEALAAFAPALQRRLQEAAAAKAGGRADWWRLREACLLGVGALAERIEEQRQLGSRGGRPRGGLDAAALLEAVLHEDLAGSQVPPFLLGRALWLTSRLSGAVPAARRGAFLQASVARLAPGNPPAVQIGACKAVSQLCKDVAPQELQAVSQPMYAGLCQLLAHASEDVLHLVLETLTEVVKVDPAGAAQWEPHISPPVLSAWVAHVNDPLLSEDAADLLGALAAVPAILPSLQARMLPSLGSIISAPQQHPSLLVSGSIDMIKLLLTPSPPEVAQQIHAAATPLLLQLSLQSDEADVLQSATGYLRTLFQVGGAAALSWGGASPEASLHALLQPVQRLLQPGLGDSPSHYVGSLLLELLRHAGDMLAPSLPGLLTALAEKLGAAEDPAFVQSLILVVATLVHTNLNQTVDCLAGLQLADGRSVLQAVMSKWTERQIEVRTPYAIKLTTTALAALLASRHPALQHLQVKGKRVDTEGGIRTRTRARSQQEQWSTMALPLKISLLLTDAYIETTTQGEDEAEDDDSEGWEEASEEDDQEDGASKDHMPLIGIDALLDRAGDYSALADVDPLEAARREGDPVSAVDLGPFLHRCFRQLRDQQPALVQALGPQLTPTQTAALQPVFSQQ